MNGTKRMTLAVAALLALFVALGARPALAATIKEGDKAVGDASKVVDAAKAADKKADDAQTKADKSKDAADAPQKKADSAAKSAEQATAEAKKAQDAKDRAETRVEDAANRKPPDKAAEDAARKAYRDAADKAAAAQKAADAAAKAAEAAAAKAKDPTVTEPLNEKAEADKKAAEEERKKADAAKAEAQKKIEEAEKVIDSMDGSQNRRKKELEGLKGSVNTIAFGPAPTGDMLASLAASGKIAVTLAGTGETIGNVVNLTLKNLTAKSLSVGIPATVLSSVSGQFQPYINPYNITVALGPGETKTVALDGVCADGHKPPVGNGVAGELAMADPKSADTLKLVKGVQNIMTAAERLQLSGAITTPFSGNPSKERETIIQWTTWAFTSAKSDRPITKADLAKKVHEQAGATTAEQNTQLDRGVDQIWAAVQLTGKAAKVLD